MNSIPPIADDALEAPHSLAKMRGFALKEWDALRAFLDVARTRSISEAAGKLELQHSTLSRRLARIEKKLGRKLIERKSRGIRLTPDGMELLSVLERFDEELIEVSRWITRDVKGMSRPMAVHLSCTEGVAAYWLTRFLPGARAWAPHVCFNIHAGLRAPEDRGKPVHGTISLFQPQTAAHVHQLGLVHFYPMASTRYIQRHGLYRAGGDPRAHRWIEFSTFELMSGSWETWFRGKRIEVAPAVVTSSLPTVVNAVLEGAGIALLPSYMLIHYPDLQIVPAGISLKFPIHWTVDPGQTGSAEVAAATRLVRTAISPHHMPWFGEQSDETPDIALWRRLAADAIPA